MSLFTLRCFLRFFSLHKNAYQCSYQSKIVPLCNTSSNFQSNYNCKRKFNWKEKNVFISCILIIHIWLQVCNYFVFFFFLIPFLIAFVFNFHWIANFTHAQPMLAIHTISSKLISFTVNPFENNMNSMWSNRIENASFWDFNANK